MAQLMPLPLTVSCFSKMQIGFTFLVPAHLGSPGKGPYNGCGCVRYLCIVCSSATEAADGVESLQIDSRNSPAEKNPSTHND